MGPLGREASEFLNDLGRRLSLISDDARETSNLFQRVSVLIQRYNAVAFGAHSSRKMMMLAANSRHCF